MPGTITLFFCNIDIYYSCLACSLQIDAWFNGYIYVKNKNILNAAQLLCSLSQLCPSRQIWAYYSWSIISRPTHSEVIWATSCREVKPELSKLSLYWLILIAASQSSTELKVLKSGMDLSNSGWEGLEKEVRERGRWMYKQVVGTIYSVRLFIWPIGRLNCDSDCYCSERLALANKCNLAEIGGAYIVINVLMVK